MRVLMLYLQHGLGCTFASTHRAGRPQIPPDSAIRAHAPEGEKIVNSFPSSVSPQLKSPKRYDIGVLNI